MKLIIDAPDEIVKKGFEGPLTDEERQILIRAIGNGIAYKERQGEWVLAYCSCGDRYYTCSICNRVIEVKNDQSLKDYPFCHCGAKMVIRGKE